MLRNTQEALNPMSNNLPPQRVPGVFRTRDLCSETTCWSQLSLDQNPQALVFATIARVKDPREVVKPCRETHGKR